MIVAWNGLKSVHKIRAGQQLALYIIDDSAVLASTIANRQNPAITTTSAVTDHESLLVLADNKKSNPEAEGSTQEEFSWYQVKNGDTLWNISRRFNTSPKKIKAWNNLESNLIHPGNKLRLKDV
jgi:membrane-bound lytic murein transglycosylase D